MAEKKYIDVEKIEWRWLPLSVINDVFITGSDIEQMPAADVSEVRHAEWVTMSDADGTFYACSECGEWSKHKTRFCADCGADMRGEDQ